MELKRIDPLSVAKVTAILYGAMGLLFGGLFSLLALMGFALDNSSTGAEAALTSMIFGVGAVIILPLFYGILGGIFAALGAMLYNLIARFFGGIRVDLE